MLNKINLSKELREFKYELSNTMRKLREERGLSVADVSYASKVGVSFIEDFEMGNVKDWNMLSRLARFYKKKIRLEFYQ